MAWDDTAPLASLATCTSVATRDKKDKKKHKKDKKGKDKKDKKDDKPKEPKKPRVETVKTDLISENTRWDLAQLDVDMFSASKAKLIELELADKDRTAKETALNELQSFSFDLGDKMYEEEHEAASTAAEREAVQAEVGKLHLNTKYEINYFLPRWARSPSGWTRRRGC